MVEGVIHLAAQLQKTALPLGKLWAEVLKYS
jgi:hypothetical protein